MGQVDAPSLAQMTGADVVRLAEGPERPVPYLARLALAKPTMDAHKRWLRELTDLPIVYAKMQVGDGLVSWMAELRRRRRWKWSTTARNMAALAGALSLLPAYRRTPTTIRLTDDAIWKLATRAVAKKQYQELPRQAHAASYDDIRRCVSTTKCLPTRVALILSWAFCGRVGDVLRLKKDELTVRPNPTTGFTEVTVRFTRAKTTPQRGPYTLHTAISQAWGELLVRWMAERRTWLFPKEVTTGSITAALRQVRPELECRSIRRGSLQTMASAGVPEATLLEFSAHTRQWPCCADTWAGGRSAACARSR